jgi:hypothetical protein
MPDPNAPDPSTTLPAGGSVLVVAPPERAEHVVRALDGLAPSARPVNDVSAALAHLGGDTIAIVAAPQGQVPGAADGEREAPPRGATPEPDLGAPEGLLEALAADERAAALPVVLVVDDGFPDARARRLHALGAAAVLAWPSEVRLLPGLVLSLCDATLAVRRTQHAEAGLADAIEARIAVDATPAGELRCKVAEVTAILRGETDSPWRARRLHDLVANVPGIEEVDARELHVIPPVVPDDELDRTVRDVIRSALGEAIEGLELTTSAGAVTLTGIVASDEERRRLEGVVENVPGVTHLDARLEVQGTA